MNIPTCYVDADGWPDTVTVTTGYNGTSSGGYATTGTATFTYTRARMADLVACPKLLFCDGPSALASRLPDGHFLAVRLGIGQAPGWIAIFAPQTPQTNAFTQTYTPAGGGAPAITHFDAYCSLDAYCALTAPGLWIPSNHVNSLPDASEGGAFLTINDGKKFGDVVASAPLTVTLVQPGVPANLATKQAAIAPVYRVSLAETGPFQISALTLIVNGTAQALDGDSGDTSTLASSLGSLLELLPGGDGGQVESRSPWTCEVQMPEVGDTLGTGTISYIRLVRQDSLLSAPGMDLRVIDNPFPMAGQTFTYGPDAGGFHSSVHF